MVLHRGWSHSQSLYSLIYSRFIFIWFNRFNQYIFTEHRINLCMQELMSNSELISRIASALIKGELYERVSTVYFYF